MKRVLIFLTVLMLSLPSSLIASGAPRGGSQTAGSEARAAAAIKSIQREYAKINKGLVRYRKVKKELSGFSLEGGALIGYLDGPAVVKIVANHYGEMGRSVEEYYYANGKLIFIFRRDFDYDKPLSGKVVRRRESRFYFQNDRLFRWINEEGKRVSPDSMEYEQRQNDILETSRKFVDGVRSKNATIEA